MANDPAEFLNTVSSSRRSFLKLTSLAAASSAVPASEASASTTHSKEMPRTSLPNDSPVDYVNLLQGTQSTPVFSHGNTLPIAAMPFGMAHWTVQSNAGTPWFFQPWNRRIQGFRCTHQLSPWLYDYGFATFLPVAGKVHGTDAPARASSYVPEDAKLTPYSLELFLLRYRTHIELVPTERCCVLAADFDTLAPSNTPQVRGFIIDIPSVAGEIVQDKATRRIRFACNQTSGGTPKNFATYYVVEFDTAWESCEIEHHKDHNDNDRQVLAVYFAPGKRLESRIATSFISFDQAAFNLQTEIGTSTVEELRQRGKDTWNNVLRRILIEGATQDQARTFYSCLYRTMLFPRVFHEPVLHGSGMHHYSCFSGKVEPGVMYADHGFWDVYRAWYPLGTILFPERIAEILEAWVNVYKEGGWFPQFPAPGYRACMSGSLIDSLFADAIVKNIGNFDRKTVLTGLKKHATEPGDPDKGYGRVGVDLYMRLHYVPADKIEQSVAETADAAYGDFCIAQIAKAVGQEADYEEFMRRSAYWRNIYDTQVSFFRGKNSDGSWLSPFDSFTWGSPYEEGSAWQHRWDAPHAVPGLIEAIGGRSAAVNALEQMLSVPPIFHVGVYGDEIHEMSEMAAVPFGQYAHSNQPSHHLLYLFAHAGRPDRLQFEVRRVMDQLYSPDSFAGDEDTGSMAAWYILSSLGIYQVCPGMPEYTLGSPLFPRATVQLTGGKTLVVEAHANSPENVYVQQSSFNGKRISGLVVTHDELMSGGTLRFEMSSTARA
ncbi:MAG: GH92 family glycosyl hydrolase [Janthinobacterium lividum]